MKTETLSQLREILGGASTATLITRTRNDFLRARPMLLAAVEESGRIWLASAAGGETIEGLERGASVHLVFQRADSSHVSVNGMATLETTGGRRARLSRAPLEDWLRSHDKGERPALICVEPRNVVWWTSGPSNTVAHMFRVAKISVCGKGRIAPELNRLNERHLLAA